MRRVVEWVARLFGFVRARQCGEWERLMREQYERKFARMVRGR